MAEKKEKEVVEEATKPVAPIDLSALKNLEVASERDESLKGIKKASEMKKKKSKFCFMGSPAAHRSPMRRSLQRIPPLPQKIPLLLKANPKKTQHLKLGRLKLMTVKPLMSTTRKLIGKKFQKT